MRSSVSGPWLSGAGTPREDKRGPLKGETGLGQLPDHLSTEVQASLCALGTPHLW